MTEPTPPEAREERTPASLWIDERRGERRKDRRTAEIIAWRDIGERWADDRRAADRGRGARRETT